MLVLQRTIIYLIVSSLLSSNVLWAGGGQLDSMLDTLFSAQEHATWSVDNNVMNHVIDQHYDGHDCHMSAHLTALSSIPFSMAGFDNTQRLPFVTIYFFTRKLPPPNRPPRA